MKLRNSLTAFALGLSTLAGMAQTGLQNLRIKEKGKTVFNPHWYMQLQAGASHTVGEVSFGDLISPAMGVFAGYQFSPVWGLRSGLTGWKTKGAWASPKNVYDYNYLQGNVDATLDLGNLFRKYNPKHFFNPYMFAGIGVNGAFNNDKAVAVHTAGNNLEYLWDDKKVNVVGRFGLGTNLRLSNKIYFNIEANANVLSDHYNSQKDGNADWQFNALAGVTIKLGKTYKKTKPVYYKPRPVHRTPTSSPVVESEPTTESTVLVESLQENIFFLINSAEIRQSEMTKIDSLVDYLNEHQHARVSICGYADRGTGISSINKLLSKQRANSVFNILKNKGIAINRITVDHKGDTVQPFSINDDNRVCICIAE